MAYNGSVSVRSHVDVFAPDWICTTSPVSTPSSSRSYARCLTRPPPGECTNNNAETTQQHRDENLLKKTSLKFRSRVVKKSANTNSTPAFIPPHQPMSEWKPDVVYLDEGPDLGRVDCHGNTEDFSRETRVEEGDPLDVFQPAWLRQRETRIKDDGEVDVDPADGKLPGVKRKKKSKACKAWRMQVHGLKDADEEEDKVHFAPTWMKKTLSKSDDITATKTMTHCEGGHKLNIRHDEGVGTIIKTPVVLERSTEELIDNIEAYDEHGHCRVEAETSSSISCPKENTIESVKESDTTHYARSTPHDALFCQSEGEALTSQEKNSSFRFDCHVVSCVGDSCSWSPANHPEVEKQVIEFVFQVLQGAVVSLLVEEVARNSLKENAKQGDRRESKSTEGQNGDCEENNEQRIDTNTNDVLVRGIVSSNEDSIVCDNSDSNTSYGHDVDGGKAATYCGTLELGSNRQSEVQLINKNSTMTSTTSSEPGELTADNYPSSDEGSTPHRNFLRDAGSLDGSLEAETTKDDGDSSFESIFGEETLIDDCLQEDARENGYAASVAVLDGAEEDGLIADVRLLWMLDEDEDDLDRDEMKDGYRAGDDDDGGGGGDNGGDDEEEWEGKEEATGDEDVAGDIDVNDVEDELMTDVQPPWGSMNSFKFSDDYSTENLQRIREEPDSGHQTTLEAPGCKIKNPVDAIDNTTVRIHYKNLTHVSTNPGRGGRRPQIILELDVLTTPGNFEKRRLEFYSFVEKHDRGKLRFRKPFKSRPKKSCHEVCETAPSHVQDGENMCEVLENGPDNYHRTVTKGTSIKGIRKNILRKSKLPKWKKVKKWFR